MTKKEIRNLKKEQKQKIKNEKQEAKKLKKQKKQLVKEERKKHKARTFKIGTRKKRIFALWAICIMAFGMGIYRSVALINTHTIYKETTVYSRIQNHSNIENFVLRFADIFFEHYEAVSVRREQLLVDYLSDEMMLIHRDRFTPLSNDVLVLSSYIWSVEQIDEYEFDVLFSVRLDVDHDTHQHNHSHNDNEESEGHEHGHTYRHMHYHNRGIENGYIVRVLKDSYGDMVITRKAFASLPSRSNIEIARMENDLQFDMSLRNEVINFLELFFSVYPRADERELNFYVEAGALDLIERNIVFTNLSHTAMRKNDYEQIIVNVRANFLCEVTATNQVVEYFLTIEQVGGNFRVVDSN